MNTISTTPTYMTPAEYARLASAKIENGQVTVFCLSEVHNTWITRTDDGWYNSDTETEYPYDSYTGAFYSDIAKQIEEQRAALRYTLPVEVDEYLTVDGMMEY